MYPAVMLEQVIVAAVTSVCVVGLWLYFRKPDAVGGALGSADWQSAAAKQQRLIDELQTQLNEQAQKLKALTETQPLLAAVATAAETQHLRALSEGFGSDYANHEGLRDELRSLQERGLIAKTRPSTLHELPHRFDLAQEFELTQLGALLLELRTRHHLQDAVGPRSQASS